MSLINCYFTNCSTMYDAVELRIVLLTYVSDCLVSALAVCLTATKLRWLAANKYIEALASLRHTYNFNK